MKKYIFAAFVLLLFVSCESQDHAAVIDKHLIGTWERVSERLHAATPTAWLTKSVSISSNVP